VRERALHSEQGAAHLILEGWAALLVVVSDHWGVGGVGCVSCVMNSASREDASTGAGCGGGSWGGTSTTTVCEWHVDGLVGGVFVQRCLVVKVDSELLCCCEGVVVFKSRCFVMLFKMIF
jgi:hypothetical protein